MKTRRLCCRCGNPVIRETKVKQYPFYCPTCDENMFRLETERVKGDKKWKKK